MTPNPSIERTLDNTNAASCGGGAVNFSAQRRGRSSHCVAETLITMYRPTGPEELELVRQSGFARWPPRLPDQPIFYPVTNQPHKPRFTLDHRSLGKPRYA